MTDVSDVALAATGFALLLALLAVVALLLAYRNLLK